MDTTGHWIHHRRRRRRLYCPVDLSFLRSGIVPLTSTTARLHCLPLALDLGGIHFGMFFAASATCAS